jgi:hypothetical protein
MIVMAEIPRATLTRQKKVLSLNALTASKEWMSSREKTFHLFLDDAVADVDDPPA